MTAIFFFSRSARAQLYCKAAQLKYFIKHPHCTFIQCDVIDWVYTYVFIRVQIEGDFALHDASFEARYRYRPVTCLLAAV